MKRIFSIIALILALVLALVSCADTPTVEISEDGYWIINGEKTDVLAKGEKGDQGIQGEKGDAATNENPQGLYFFLKDDWTYVVEIGLAKYLSKIEIPTKYNGRSVTEIGNLGFQSDRLVEIAIPDSVTSIGKSAFSSCKSLTSVTIGNSVTSIDGSAFYNCENLASITIPDSVTSIGEWAFYYCTSLKSIKYRGTEAEWNAISKGYNWNYDTGNYTITYNYDGEWLGCTKFLIVLKKEDSSQ